MRSIVCQCCPVFSQPLTATSSWVKFAELGLNIYYCVHSGGNKDSTPSRFRQFRIDSATAGEKVDKKYQDQIKTRGFYRPSYTRPILTPGIQICSQKQSQVNISIDYGYISQVILPYKVKFSKLEICQSDCRFKILAKNCVKKVSFFFQNFDQNIVKINIIRQNQAKFRQKSNFTLFWMFNANFDYVPIKISKKERYFLLIVFSKDFESAIRLTNFQL